MHLLEETFEVTRLALYLQYILANYTVLMGMILRIHICDRSLHPISIAVLDCFVAKKTGYAHRISPLGIITLDDNRAISR
jgi:hypothetical protein